jgi:phosphoribosylglycinamide formyltransferase-1
MKRIVILASGSGTNAENIVKYFAGSNDVEIVSILSNKKDAYVLTRAANLGISHASFTKAEFESGEVTSIIRGMEPDLIVLSGFLLKVPESMVEAFPHKIINIHPALLPKFGGKGMYGDRVHEAVVAAGETESGITIHYIDENYDQGVTIFQAKCHVLPTDTPHDVATKVHALEYEWFPKIIEKVLFDRII